MKWSGIERLAVIHVERDHRKGMIIAHVKIFEVVGKVFSNRSFDMRVTGDVFLVVPVGKPVLQRRIINDKRGNDREQQECKIYFFRRRDVLFGKCSALLLWFLL